MRRISAWRRAAQLLSVAALLLASASAQAAQITWAGCGITKNGITKALATAYERKTGVTIEVRGGGALKGLRDARAGRVDVAGSCRYALPVPQEAGANMIPVAWDGLVMITARDNPVTGLTSQQTRDVFEGRITNWKALGGRDERIALFTRRGKLSGVGHMFRVMFFRNPYQEYPTAEEAPRSSGLIEMLVGKGSGGFGLSGASSAHKRPEVKMLSLDGVYPSQDNIASGRYYLIRPLYYVLSDSASPQTQGFIDFALSAEGQAIVEAEGVVSLAQGRGLTKLFKERFGAQYLAAPLRD
ncbi:substrate-binding domain-containing protein [Magnetofaba australis]|uniref:Putative extracellular solute-binding protein n=1 Tax=Magnetofaba australis IT-1 TaxID=1434232 RepID=A0A1Y2KAP8_9PROT|nr:substrate-binding domain-containing protein [Magnetofaba australis]OSM07004.1 putative extracellular solute-binding protein [Magnetofaba australis IT-1]